jgi:hypothetical protein
MADVVISAEFAEQLKDTLTTLYYYSTANDLQEGYRKMQTEHKTSVMTARLKSNLEMLQSMIDLAEATEEVSDEHSDDGEPT